MRWKRTTDDVSWATARHTLRRAGSLCTSILLLAACERAAQRASPEVAPTGSTTQAGPPLPGPPATSAAATTAPTRPSGSTPKRLPIPAIERGAGSTDARAALTAYLDRQQFLAPYDPTREEDPACGAVLNDDGPQPYIGFVSPRVLGFGAERADSAGEWTTGVAAVTLVFSSPDAFARDDGRLTVPVRFTPKVDTLAFRLHRPASSNRPIGEWVVCPLPDGVSRHATYEQALRLGLGRTRWEPAHMTWALARLFADSVHAVRAGRPWRRNPPPPPIVARGLCPGEGCDYGEWLACSTIPIRSAERVDAPVVFSLRPGETFTGVTGNVHVEQPGMIVFRDTLRMSGGSDIPRTFTPADTLFPLYYIGEGSGTWYLNGREEEGDWFFRDRHVGISDNPKIEVVRERKSRWWVKVKSERGEEGWLDMNEPGAAVRGIAPHYEEYPLKCGEGSER